MEGINALTFSRPIQTDMEGVAYVLFNSRNAGRTVAQVRFDAVKVIGMTPPA